MIQKQNFSWAEVEGIGKKPARKIRNTGKIQAEICVVMVFLLEYGAGFI